MGAVYRAARPGQAPVALKLILADELRSEETAARFHYSTGGTSRGKATEPKKSGGN
jgi:hypothetical protein